MLRRSDLTTMVAEVPAHKDEGIGVYRRSRKGPQMADCMSWCIEEIERTVSEKVMSSEAADLYAVRLEGYLS